MMALFFFIAHENGFKFHARPQTDAYSCYFISRRCTVPCEVLGLLQLAKRTKFAKFTVLKDQSAYIFSKANSKL